MLLMIAGRRGSLTSMTLRVKNPFMLLRVLLLLAVSVFGFAGCADYKPVDPPNPITDIPQKLDPTAPLTDEEKAKLGTGQEK